MRILRAFLFFCCIGIAARAYAGASVFGFSIGEDTMTLSAILTQAIQQVAILKDVAAFTRDMKENVEFVKDVYETANDVINARWERLSDEFVGELLNADPALREIAQNTQAVITNRVPRGNRFRALIGAGFKQIVFEAFGPYPFGPEGSQYALSDYRSVNLNALADQQMSEWSRKRAAKRIEQAWDECDEGLEACERAGARMQTQTAKTLEDMKALQAEQARAQATQMAIENAERKRRASGNQRDLAGIVNAASKLREKQQPAVYREEDFQ